VVGLLFLGGKKEKRKGKYETKLAASPLKDAGSRSEDRIVGGRAGADPKENRSRGSRKERPRAVMLKEITLGTTSMNA